MKHFRKSGTPALVALILMVSSMTVDAQVTTIVPDASMPHAAPIVALTHARLVIEPGKVVDAGTLVMRGGVIEAVGAQVRVPAGARVLDLQGRTVFAGFIDARGEDGEPDATPVAAPQVGTGQWNPLLMPQRDMAAGQGLDAQRAGKLRQAGFTSAVSAPAKGILRGSAALFSTATVSRPGQALLAPGVAQVAALEVNRGVDRYPTSKMGSMALIRQTLHDARWYQQYAEWQRRQPLAERVEPNLALEALAPVVAGRQALLLNADQDHDYVRGQALASEFGLQVLLMGNGQEYRTLARTDAQPGGIELILPLTFPEAPEVEDADAALDLSLAQLEHWEWAPFNPRIVAEAGVRFALSPVGLKAPETEFWTRLRQAVQSGLTEEAALRALTLAPARMLGVEDRLGSLKPGRLAHLLIADADVLRSADARIHGVWIDGVEYPLADANPVESLSGEWRLDWAGAEGPATLRIEVGQGGRANAIAAGWKFPLSRSAGSLRLHPPGAMLGLSDEQLTLVAELGDDAFEGHVLRAGHDAIRVRGTRQGAHADRPLAAALPRPPLPDALRYPVGEYGRVSRLEQRSILVRNATVWTQGPQGRLDDADLLIRDGTIRAVGHGLQAPASMQVIDGRGLHVTPGLIDSHSHVATTGGIVEMSHAVTSEVRVDDALDPSDITLYRQLAAGVTAAHLLHGSVNPIGGQSQVIKLRWGSSAAGLRFAEAQPAIKFAMGENVKQTHWSMMLEYSPRYPQTRMGVQAAYRDWFGAARDYMNRSGRPGEPLRRDLRMESLVEVLSGKRRVHIHGYRQDEILAFARLSQEFGIKPVFTHALEAYKIAPELGALGAEVSTFSDWWGFKMEMAEAIPYNAGMLARHGVVVSLKSDDGELARRLNIEAAKAIKYSGFEATDALALVTINPARQLGVAHRVGSLEPGKDADFVIWSADPLSVEAVPQQTWIDGRKYYDIEEDAVEQQRISQARERLIRKALRTRVEAPSQLGTVTGGAGR